MLFAQANSQESANGDEICILLSRCDCIFDEMLKNVYIKLSHHFEPLPELKRHAYCKWYNYVPDATNDRNVFLWQVQSTISKGRLSILEMQVHIRTFLINTLEWKNPIISVRCNQAKSTTRKKNMIIDYPRGDNKIIEKTLLCRETMLERSMDG